MTTTLLLVTVLIGGSQTSVPTPKPEATQPDVLLTRSEDVLDAEKALNEHRLDPGKLLFLTKKKPVVACYGRLAEETRRSERDLTLATTILQDKDSTWTRQRAQSVRALIQESGFREVIRQRAIEHAPQRLQFLRSSVIAYQRPDGHYRMKPLNAEPLGSPLELAPDLVRLDDLPTGMPSFSARGRRGQQTICCLADFGIVARDKLPAMQSALKAFATRAAEYENTLMRTLPPRPVKPLTESERASAVAYFTENHASLGYASRDAAIAELRDARFFKYTSLDVRITSEGVPSVGWTVKNLTTP